MRYFIVAILLGLMGCMNPSNSGGYQAAPVPAPPASAPQYAQGAMQLTLVTREAPEFTADAVMPDGSFQEISLSDYRGKYLVLFFYPLDFTFVCPTEIVAFNNQLDQFKKIGCEVIGVSADSKYTHLAWRNTPKTAGGIGKIQYPLVSDITKNISRSFGILHDESVALRGLYLIDPKGVVRHALVNDLALGRNIDEALRTCKALQLIDKHGEFCPANWKPGDKSINASKESMEEYFSRQQK